MSIGMFIFVLVCVLMAVVCVFACGVVVGMRRILDAIEGKNDPRCHGAGKVEDEKGEK